MTEIIFPEFRDEFDSLNYPFSDDATLITTDNLPLDPALFLDAAIYPVGLSAGGRLVSIQVSTTQIVFTIGDSVSSNLATTTINLSSYSPTMPLTDSFGRPAGVLLIDPTLLPEIIAWPIGTHTFAVGGAEFVSTTCTPSPVSQVNGITVNGEGLLTGEVWLVGDRGVILRGYDNSVRVDIVGDPLFVRALCSPIQQFTTPLFIKTINHQTPDAYGNFNITVSNSVTPDTILRIYPTNNGLKIEAAGPLIQG